MFIRCCAASDRLAPENHNFTFTRLLILGELLISLGAVQIATFAFVSRSCLVSICNPSAKKSLLPHASYSTLCAVARHNGPKRK